MKRQTRSLCGAAALLTVAGLPAQAQAPRGSDARGLEEITVTARKSAENLQEVPLTVSAFSGEALQEQGVRQLIDLNMVAPGLNMASTGNRGGTGRLMMRGLTAGTSGSAKASVFLDGVYVTGDITNIPFEALDRVEVLPGPQSAVFGRSTFAGAVNFITRDPGTEFRGRISADVASAEERRYSVLASGPIFGEKLGVLVNAFRFSYGGPGDWRNPLDGSRLGAIRSQGVLAKLVSNPVENLHIELRGLYTDDRDSMGEVFTLDPRQRNGRFTKIEGPLAGQPVFYPVGTIPNVYRQPDGGQNSNSPLSSFWGRAVDGYRLSGEITYTLADWTLALTQAHNREHSFNALDGDATYFPQLFSLTDTYPTDRQTEFRISSPADKRVRVTAGYFTMKFNTRQKGFAAFDQACATAAQPLNNQCILGTTYSFIKNPVGNILVNTKNLVEDKAPFLGIFVDITDRLTASAEVRRQSEEVTTYPSAGTTAAPFNNTFKSTLPRFNVDYRINDDVHVYGVVSKGNNPGGFNTAAGLGTVPGTSLDDRFILEEKLKNYEVGIKSLWLDRRLRVNAAVYKMDWDNQQIPSTIVANTGQIFAVTRNNGASRIRGATLEVEALPMDGLTLRLMASHNDAKYVNFCSTNLAALLGVQARPVGQTATLVNPINGQSFVVGQLACVPVNGNVLDGQPPTNLALGATFERAFNADWRWSVNGDFQHQSGMWESEMNLAKSKPANVFNLGFGMKNDRWDLSLYCRNCTDERSPYRVTRFSDTRAGNSNQFNQNVTQLPRRPRQFGVRAAVDF